MVAPLSVQVNFATLQFPVVLGLGVLTEVLQFRPLIDLLILAGQLICTAVLSVTVTVKEQLLDCDPLLAV